MGRGERQQLEAAVAMNDPGSESRTGPPVTKESPFDVVDHIPREGGTVIAIFRDGPRPRGPADRHGAIDVDGERVAVFVQTGPSWPVPEVLDRGRALLGLADRNVARAFHFGPSKNKYHWAIERAGGVALPALVRRVRKRSGTLPTVTCARIARDVLRAHLVVEKAAPRPARRAYRMDINDIAAVLADTVVSWDGRVVVAPRMFGTPADAPRWVHRNTIIDGIGALLLAMLASIDVEANNGNIDFSVLELLARPGGAAPLEGTGSAALEDVIARALASLPPPAPRRRGRPAPGPARLTEVELLSQLDDVVRDLGGDNESFAAALMNEIFPDRKRADLAWREEMTAVSLA